MLPLSSSPSSSGVTNPDHAVRLNAADSKLIGPAMTLRVQKGDEVDLSVYAKYLDAAQSSTSTSRSFSVAVLQQSSSISVIAEIAGLESD